MALRSRRPLAASRAPIEGAFLEAVLRVLHPDRDAAAERYEAIRERLRRFFNWRGGRWPDELTDETIDRVGRRLAEGETIRTTDVARYFLGVARNVLREAWQREQAQGVEPDASALVDRAAQPAKTAEDETHMACLERCLEELAPASRDLVLRYYQGEGGALVEGRRALATELGLAAGTLRIRLHRLRARVEACVRGCLADHETSPPPVPPTSRSQHR